MDTLQNILLAFEPINVLMVVLGTASGILLGATPGLTATMAIALLVPFSYGYPMLPATALLLGIYVGGMYGGSITAILMRIPGAPCNAATMLEGYPLTKKGMAGKAIAMSTIASTIGGLFSCVILITSISVLAEFALAFSVQEYFVLTLFGLIIIIALSGSSWVKGFISAIIGLLIGTIGLDLILPHARFTFGVEILLIGVPVVPAMIGLFAVSQAFRMLEEGGVPSHVDIEVKQQSIQFDELWGMRKTLLRSSVIGTVIGLIPAAGPTISAFLGYTETRRASKTPEKFGTGVLEGIAGSEAANNAVPPAALVPLLSFGIPGDTVTAILLGALMLHGYSPGPMLLRDNLDLLYPMFAFLIMSNISMLFMGLFGARHLAKLISMTGNRVLVAVIFMFGIAGGFVYSGQIAEAWITVIFGIIGYFFEKFGISIVPMAIMIILGPMMEVYLRQSLIWSGGDVTTLFFRPITIVLWVLIIFLTWSSIKINRRIVESSKKQLEEAGEGE